MLRTARRQCHTRKNEKARRSVYCKCRTRATGQANEMSETCRQSTNLPSQGFEKSQHKVREFWIQSMRSIPVSPQFIPQGTPVKLQAHHFPASHQAWYCGVDWTPPAMQCRAKTQQHSCPFQNENLLTAFNSPGLPPVAPAYSQPPYKARPPVRYLVDATNSINTKSKQEAA